jgi:hypothetical protein
LPYFLQLSYLIRYIDTAAAVSVVEILKSAVEHILYVFLTVEKHPECPSQNNEPV